jgi:uncharacterized LabA/DUF88 family protein
MKIEKKKIRRYLFVDGSNLYAGQYDLFGPNQYLFFPDFMRVIEDTLGFTFDAIYYYTSFTRRQEVMTRKMIKFTIAESAFHKSVAKTSRLIFFKGYRSKTSGKEKEVDVKLAVDIVDLSHRDLMDEIYLFSADADYMHALLVAKRLKKKIAVMSIENRLPYRYSFLFRTIVAKFNKEKMNVNKPQRIEFLEIEKNEVIRDI